MVPGNPDRGWKAPLWRLISLTELAVPALHLDLLHPSRRTWKGRLVDCRLQTLERYVCRRRRFGDVAGADVPGLYHDFVRRGDAYRMIPVFHHNLLDVITMYEILRALCGGTSLVERTYPPIDITSFQGEVPEWQVLLPAKLSLAGFIDSVDRVVHAVRRSILHDPACDAREPGICPLPTGGELRQRSDIEVGRATLSHGRVGANDDSRYRDEYADQGHVNRRDAGSGRLQRRRREVEAFVIVLKRRS